MSSPARSRSRLALALVTVAALAAPAPSLADVFAFPHVLEVAGTNFDSTGGTTFGTVPIELLSLELTTSRTSPVCNPCTLPIGGVSVASYGFDTTMFYSVSGGPPQAGSFFDVFTEIEVTRLTDPIEPVQTFDTEMLALDLVVGPAMIRESPTRASHGRYTYQASPGGGYAVDSFFDIFVELSFDGGASWTPADSALHMQLVPEPSTALLAAIGLAGLGLRSRRR